MKKEGRRSVARRGKTEASWLAEEERVVGQKGRPVSGQKRKGGVGFVGRKGERKGCGFVGKKRGEGVGTKGEVFFLVQKREGWVVGR